MAKAKSRGSKNQRRVVVPALIALILIGATYWVYSNRPGAEYAKLQKQFDSLKLPADWQETGTRTGEKDGWFGTCRDLTITCPVFETKIHDNSLEGVTSTRNFKKVLRQNNFEITSDTNKCSNEKDNSTTDAEIFRCSTIGKRGELKIELGIKSELQRQSGNVDIGILW